MEVYSVRQSGKTSGAPHRTGPQRRTSTRQSCTESRIYKHYARFVIENHAQPNNRFTYNEVRTEEIGRVLDPARTRSPAFNTLSDKCHRHNPCKSFLEGSLPLAPRGEPSSALPALGSKGCGLSHPIGSHKGQDDPDNNSSHEQSQRSIDRPPIG